MSNTQLRDQAVDYLKQTTVGWNKVAGYSSAKLAATNWGKAMTSLEQITDSSGSGYGGKWGG